MAIGELALNVWGRGDPEAMLRLVGHRLSAWRLRLLNTAFWAARYGESLSWTCDRTERRRQKWNMPEQRSRWLAWDVGEPDRLDQEYPDGDGPLCNARTTVAAAANPDPLLQKAFALVLRDFWADVVWPVESYKGLRTPCVVSLAQAVWDGRGRTCTPCAGHGCGTCLGRGRIDSGTLDPALLGALADLLERQGLSADDHFVTHLRSGLPHYRGCWVIEQILAKE